MHRRRTRHAIVLAGFAAALALTNRALADRYYVGPTNGNWNNPANWSATNGGAGGAGVPGPGTGQTYMVQSDSNVRNISLDTSPSIGILNIGNTSLFTTHLNQTTSVNLSATGESLGFGASAHAAHLQSSGNNVYDAFLILGDYPGSTGQYDVSGNATVVVKGNSGGAFAVGNLGNGTFNQTGGSVTVGSASLARPLLVGAGGSSVGNYFLSGGSLTVIGSETLGHGDPGLRTVGNFIQTGGNNSTNGLSIVGASSYQLSGGSNSVLNVHGIEIIGTSVFGDATFSQLGGVHTVDAGLLLGNRAGSTGNYFLSGGTNIIDGGLVLGQSQIGTLSDGNGRYAVSDNGALFVNGDVAVGDANYAGNIAEGSFDVSGGSATISGTLRVMNQYADSDILFTGGALTVGQLDLRLNPSIFEWYGGVLRITAAVTEIGASTSLGPERSVLAGQGLIADMGVTIDSGANLTLNGGTLSTPTLSNFGTYNQSAGTLTMNGTFVNRGTASFGGSQAWGASGVFVNQAGVATFSTPLSTSGFGPVVVVTGGSVNFAASPGPLSRLSISAAPVTLTAGGNKTMVVSSLSIDALPGGKLDLTNNAMVVTGTPLATIKNYIASAFNNGSWNGIGVTSSNAAAIAADSANVHKTALGYASASNIGVTLFRGQSVPGSDVLVRYTYNGDANLDGVVNALDFNAVASNFGARTSRLWYQGDFNYDGTTSTLDFTLLGTNFGLVLPSPALGSVVPEPTFFGGAVFVAAVSRRRRKP